MDGLSRRKMLIMGGGALGVLGAATTAQARSLSSGPSWSVGAGSSPDPRWVWDAEADPLVAAILDRGDVARVNELLRTWTRNDQPLPAGLPDDLRAFMERARQLPSWADPAKLAQAADFVQARGTYLILLYALGSGMLSCAIPREARAVYYSKGGANMKDRAAKTTKFGVDVHDLNAYQPDGDGIVAAVKTRLVHAGVRHLLPQSPQWSQSGSGQIPISQNDILVTWHSLATLIMRKLTEWKVPISAAESAGYLHLWQVTAHMLGVHDEYIPASWDAAYAQSHQVLDPATGPTTEGAKLADLLLTIASEAVGPLSVAARPLLDAVTRYTLGSKVSDWINVPADLFWDSTVSVGFPQWVALRESLVPLPLVPQIAWTLDEAIRNYIEFYLGEGRTINIEIPDMNRPS